MNYVSLATNFTEGLGGLLCCIAAFCAMVGAGSCGEVIYPGLLNGRCFQCIIKFWEMGSDTTFINIGTERNHGVKVYSAL